jgi:hypothetical protein
VKVPNTSFTPATDPLGHTAPLDQRARFPLLGLLLELRTNSSGVLAAAERSFGRWRELEPELIEHARPLVVSIVVHPAPASSRQSAVSSHFVQRAHSEWFIASSGANLLTARMDRGEALGFVTPELLADDAHFRYNVLECLALLLASWRDRTPVHAGAVVHAGRAALLVGPSSAGKSTLCYACVRAGLGLLAEDVVYVRLGGGVRLWGNPWRIHLLPDAPRLFPELAELPARVQANGKLKLAVDVAALGGDRLHRTAERAAVCLVERHSGRASALAPIAPAAAIGALSQELEAGFDLHARAGAVAAALAAGGAYRLELGTDLEGAVELLRELLERSSG